MKQGGAGRMSGAGAVATSARARPAEVRFRPDIQGLRAVAVGLVLLEHAGVGAVAGGFVGVDVFFVISGFLITAHLLATLAERGRIDFTAFYAARARRILPASLAVIALTAVASVILVSPLRLEQILADAIASALYVPNVAFAVAQTDYLAGTEPSPFQHFWSLGVEEQFYLLWPALLLGLFVVARRSPRGVVIGMGAVALLSFAACLVVLPQSQPWAFFSLPTRAWELAVGGVLAGVITSMQRTPAVVARILTWAGLALIVVSAVTITAETSFPGFATLAPVTGTLLVIAFGRPRDGGASWLLRSRPFQFVGLISYSLYLVHWPILVLVQEHTAPGVALPMGLGVALVVVAVPVAWLLYRFVETPFRRGSRARRSSPGRSLGLAAVGSVALAALLAGGSAAAALMPLHSDRAAGETVATLLPESAQFVPSDVSPPLDEAVADTGEIYSNGCQQSVGEAEVTTCSFGDLDSPVTVALFGDSHAGRWFPALQVAAEEEGFRLETFTKSECRSQDTDIAWANAANPTCAAWRDGVIEHLRDDPPDVVVMTNHIAPRPDRDQELIARDWEEGTVSSIERMPADTRVVTIADTPEFSSSPVLCLASHLESAAECAVPRSEAINTTVLEAQEAAARTTGSGFITMTDTVCNAETCPALIGSTLVYSDTHHMTATWSRLLGPALALQLAPFLEPGDVASVHVDADLAYGTHPDQTLDVCVPVDEVTSSDAPARPAILSVHGGGWHSGDKQGRQWRESCEWLASEGFVVFQVNYRLAPEHPFPAAIDDVRSALAWARDPEQVASYRIDPARVAAFGDSAGGNLAALLALDGGAPTSAATDGGEVAAVVTVSAPFDLTEPASAHVGRGFERVQLDYLGCADYGDCPAASAASPITFADAGSPPFYLVHARDDDLIPFDQAEALATALEASKPDDDAAGAPNPATASADVTVRPIDGAGHALSLLDAEVRADIVEWLTTRMSSRENENEGSG
ncbi:SGNH hydrolase domain-containing protein [Marisediminicola sp. LYQ134]|uniref:SGNH hydrolase domain-containing protein n=1 Tax=Marisediminicola sp. LYQ134 TaxID=3391061 RepID=UPI0039830270